MEAQLQGMGVDLYGRGGERVMVMHDWLGDHTTYDSLRPYLDGDAFTYAFVDFRGYGASRSLAGEHTVEEMVSDCVALADRLGWTRFHVVSHSFSALAAQRLALAASRRVKSVVAVCPMSSYGSPAPDDALEFFARTVKDEDAFCRLITFITANRLSSQWAMAKLRQNRSAVDPAAQLDYLRCFRSCFADEIRGLPVPFLVLISENDPGFDEASAQSGFLELLPRAELEVIPSCGHYPMQECPPYFAALIEKYMLARA